MFVWYNFTNSRSRPYGHTRNTHSSSVRFYMSGNGDPAIGVPGKGVYMKGDYLTHTAFSER